MPEPTDTTTAMIATHDPNMVLNVKQVAARYHVHAETVRRWIRTERLPAHRPAPGSRHWYVHAADLPALT